MSARHMLLMVGALMLGMLVGGGTHARRRTAGPAPAAWHCIEVRPGVVVPSPLTLGLAAVVPGHRAHCNAPVITGHW